VVAVALHAGLVALLLRAAPPQRPLELPKPIVVNLVEVPRPKPPEPVVELPQPKPVVKRPVPQPKRPVPVTEMPPPPTPATETPVIASAAPAAAPSHEVPPAAPEPAPVAAAPPPPPPAPVVEPRFDAAYLNNPAPSYPSVSRRLGEQGKVLLRVHVDEQGMPTSVVVRTSSGFERLDNVALETVRRWKFVPARRGNDPVSAYVIVPIVFNLRS
jgi:protein TonB